MEEFLKLVGVLFTTTCGLDPRPLFVEDHAPILRNGDTFDFIVVGAGSAGSVVASRLAENPKWRVLLVEAGDYPGPESEIPGTSLTQMTTESDWKYKTEPMENACQGFRGNRSEWARGKILGGSSTINGMIYTRGLPSDYDNWAKMGNRGWSWKDVEPYFKKIEKLENSTNNHYGHDGRLSLTLRDTLSEIQNTVVESGESMDIQFSKNEQALGLFTVPFNIGGGRRCSTAKAYLQKSKNKSNLYLAVNSLVTKVTMRSRRATGIEMLINGKRLVVQATREVILSGGTINSPQLLMLSGIGPAKQLKKLQITVRSDLQVGENLQDHLIDLGFYVKLKPRQSFDACTDAINYCIYKNGTYAKNNIIDLLWSLNTVSKGEEPNIHIHLLEFLQGEEIKLLSYLTMFGVKDAVVKSARGMLDHHDALFLGALLLKPKSRGRIFLKSSDPLEYPIIHTGYFTDRNNEDITALINTVDYIKKLINTPVMKALNAEIAYLDLPGCRGKDINSRDYWDCHYRHMAGTCYHPVGTCKMGPAHDKAAVVDHRLRVHGVKNLRVADASIMPTITNKNTNAPSIMIGEKAADFIKEDHRFGL